MFVSTIIAFAGMQHVILFGLLVPSVPSAYVDKSELTFKDAIFDYTSRQEEISTTEVVEQNHDSMLNETWCNGTLQCDNGGRCVNDSCQCLKGTSGDFCSIINDCEGMKGSIMCGDSKSVLCQYDQKTMKTYCLCRKTEYVYDPNDRMCKDCNCGPAGSCLLVNGKKTCRCNEGAVMQEVDYYGNFVGCRYCNCRSNSNGCSFDGYKKTCYCEKGYASITHYPEASCKECDCGSHGNCSFGGFLKFCDCNTGYSLWMNITTKEVLYKECDCGKNSKCGFRGEKRRCRCNDGYALEEGACEDINECLDSNACPRTTDCNNTMGSYECNCKEGYIPYPPSWRDPKEYGCQDIDECKETDVCKGVNTVCYNSPGNYSCECETGYVPTPPNDSPETEGCVRGSSAWRTAILVVGLILGVIFILLLFLILGRYKFRRNTRPQSDTPFESKIKS